MGIVRTEHLEKTYQDEGVPVHALKGVNLEIKRGEFLAIAGPSGSGKSTLLNLIGGLDEPTSGKVFLEGVDLATLSKGKLAQMRLLKLGFVFQAYNLIPVLTAAENVEFVLMQQGMPEKERRKKTIKLLEELDIGEYADRRPNAMSGGQQQRVAVARAIASEPMLVLADEPTANLDSETAGSLLDLMRDLNQTKGITFIFSTHDPMVMERAERLVKLKDGTIVGDERKK
ncbi:MAG: ABC transporter ATP-binding protein [candidate division Zixibacteria bacterium]|nr:ABC transporter ATP-binding protein [candidate division Zixibacteria bacterium]